MTAPKKGITAQPEVLVDVKIEKMWVNCISDVKARFSHGIVTLRIANGCPVELVEQIDGRLVSHRTTRYDKV